MSKKNEKQNQNFELEKLKMPFQSFIPQKNDKMLFEIFNPGRELGY